MAVVIGNSQLQFVLNHARSSYPVECCGFLIGISGERRIHRVLTAQNQDSRRDRYTVDPKELIQADENARRLGMEIIGIYHSHPDGPAQPSQTDLEYAWPHYAYLVLSVQNGEPKDFAVWYLDDDRTGFHLDELRVVND